MIDANEVDVSELEDKEKLAELRRVNSHLVKQLSDLKVRKGLLVEAVYEAAHDAASLIEWAPVAHPVVDKRSAAPEIAIVDLSDWQLGKKTATYNSQVCEERVGLMAQKVAQITKIQRADHPVRECHIFVTGDICEGELIFAGQAHLIDASLFRQVCLDGPRILGNFIRSMAGLFEKVYVWFVIGNHGAIAGPFRREMHPESNADAMIYQIVVDQLKGHLKNIEFGRTYIPEEAAWWEVAIIKGKTHNHNFLLAHGNQIRGFNGLPWYGFYKKILGWHSSKMLPDFDYVSTAHFHTPHRMYLNGITIWGNGSTESHNTYALEQLAASGEPSQWLRFLNPEREPGKGITAEYLVDLS